MATMVTLDAGYRTLPILTMTHFLRMTAATAFISLCTLLPFLPGRYDGLAVPLSSMAQVVGTVGLVLVPVGALWIAAERSQRLARKRYAFAFLALIASAFVWAVVCLAAVLESGFALGFAALALWGYAARRAWPRLKSLKGARREVPNMLPYSLLVVPVAVALLQLGVLGPAVDFSRNRAIRNSAPLIAAIEQYRTAHGTYPLSLLAEWPDYSPAVIGIPQYHYEPNGKAYNVFFEQFTSRLGTREFVMYNPRDEHVMTAHAGDRLQLTPEQLQQEWSRSYYALNATPHPHWKYFWFD
ncbi:MAG: hypothetical protein ACT4QD_22205 [Acidobacteriota bacterium]